MTLTETELKQIEQEAERLYPGDATICEVYLSKREAHVAAVKRERERAKENAALILDMFKRFMPKEVSIDDRKEMAMYEAYHRINKILEPEKYNH